MDLEFRPNICIWI